MNPLLCIYFYFVISFAPTSTCGHRGGAISHFGNLSDNSGHRIYLIFNLVIFPRQTLTLPDVMSIKDFKDTRPLLCEEHDSHLTIELTRNPDRNRKNR